MFQLWLEIKTQMGLQMGLPIGLQVNSGASSANGWMSAEGLLLQNERRDGGESSSVYIWGV